MGGRSSFDDPLKAFRYRVFIDGVARAGFSEVSGLKSTTDVTEYSEGGNNATTQKSPGKTKFDNITLKRGQLVRSSFGGDEDMLEWRKRVYEANAKGDSTDFRRSVEIVQYHRNGDEARRWTCDEAWPCTDKPFGDLAGASSDDSIEEYEICHEGYRLST